jgi:hypothetical protein
MNTVISMKPKKTTANEVTFVNKYEFNITVEASGLSVDEAFKRALDLLREDPESAITNEVIYVMVGADDGSGENEELQDKTIEN